MKQKEQKIKRFITILSISIPLIIVLLFGVHIEGDFSCLPSIYAGVNAGTFIVLLAALLAIKRNRRKLHEILIMTAFFLSLSFLIMYILYHATSEETSFGGTGIMKMIYYFLLITHILLSVLIIPLVLRTYLWAYLKQFDKHTRISPVAIYLWMYMAVSGVAIYLMIRPYYHI